jgi:hypothetical protein
MWHIFTINAAEDGIDGRVQRRVLKESSAKKSALLKLAQFIRRGNDTITSLEM